jgi:transposase InsO family protein
VKAVEEVAVTVGVTAAAEAVGVSPSTVYRRRKPPVLGPRPPRAAPPRSLSAEEIDRALGYLHEPRFIDFSPRTIVAVLLDEGAYVACVRTLYRLLVKYGETKERRDQLRHERYAVPRLHASAPNRVWSWDITKLHGPCSGVVYYLYVVIDIYSRYVVGWTLADREDSSIAKELFEESARRHGIPRDQLTVHADRGSSMRSLTLAETYALLAIEPSFSRPRVSNDNAFSEAQFKTLKYMPSFPDRFGSIKDAHTFLVEFFAWYNGHHRHSGIAFVTPADVHFGRATQVVEARQRVLDAAYARHPERFSRKAPCSPTVPADVWINQPTTALALHAAVPQ